MAIRAIAGLPGASSTGESYSTRYLKKKEEILKQRLQWAETELKQKYQSEVAYQKDREAAFKGVEEELNALRKEREVFSAEIGKLAKKGAGTDWRTALLQERTKLAETIAQETTKVSGQRVDLVTKAEGLFVAPVSATDQVSRAIGGQVGKFNVQTGRTADAAIDNFILRDPSLEVAFNGLSEGQKQALAIHLYNETSAQVRAGKGGMPLTQAEQDKIKTDIETRFAVPSAEIDQARLDAKKIDKTEEYVNMAGTSIGEMKKALKYIDDQLGAAGSITVSDKIASETEIALRSLAIDAYRNDGKIDAPEAMRAESLVDEKIKELSGKEPGTPEFEAAKKVMYSKLNFIDPSKYAIENYALTNVDDPILQTYVREGELSKRKEALGPYTPPEKIEAPTADDILRRGAELYYPDRSQKGFGQIAPYYSGETAKARRAFEQGVPMTAPELGTSREYATPPGPEGRFGPKEGTAGRRAPVMEQAPYRASDEIMDYTKKVREGIAAAGGTFAPQEITGAGSEIYNDIKGRYERGELKFDNLYDEISKSTTGSADMTATLGGADVAKDVKGKIIYNVLGEAYQKYLTNRPSPPSSAGYGMDGDAVE